MLRISRMVKKHHVKGWEEFEKLVTVLEAEKKPINIFFSGDKNEQGERYGEVKLLINYMNY